MRRELGMHYAIHKFDSSRGIKFLSYAVWWIRGYIWQAIQKHKKTIKIPSNILNYLNEIKKIECQLEQEEERNIDIEEIRERFLSTTHQKRNKKSITSKNLGFFEISNMVNISGIEKSLSSNVLQGENYLELGQVLEDKNVLSPIDVLLKKERKQQAWDIIETLPNEKIKGIFIDYYDLKGEKNDIITLRDLGKKYDMTGENIRLIIKKYISKIRKRHIETCS